MATHDRRPPGSWPATREALDRLTTATPEHVEDAPGEGQRIAVTNAPTVDELQAAVYRLAARDIDGIAPGDRRTLDVSVIPARRGYVITAQGVAIVDHERAAAIVAAALRLDG